MVSTKFTINKILNTIGEHPFASEAIESLKKTTSVDEKGVASDFNSQNQAESFLRKKFGICDKLMGIYRRNLAINEERQIWNGTFANENVLYVLESFASVPDFIGIPYMAFEDVLSRRYGNRWEKVAYAYEMSRDKFTSP
jgi:hypothetical protein